MTNAEVEFMRGAIMQAVNDMRLRVVRDVFEAVKTTRVKIGGRHTASDAIGILEVELSKKMKTKKI